MTKIVEELIVHLVEYVGIPAAVCFYTLFGVNKTLKKQDETLKTLTEVIQQLGKDIDKREAEQSREIDNLKHQVNELSIKVASYIK